MKKQNSTLKEKLNWQTVKRLLKEYGRLAAILLIITSSLIQGSRVPTGSMETTIRVGDWTLNNKLAFELTTPRNIPYTDIELPHTTLFKWGDPEKNDIVIFEFPGMRDEIKNSKIENYVKRCVGTPGDTIQIIDRVLFVNGKEFKIPQHINYERDFTLPASYIEEGIFPKNKKWNADNYGPLVVPKEGDVISLNKENVEEWKTFINREFGKEVVTLSGENVLINGAEAKEYTVKNDCYFMVGDNRDNSLDSRYWGFVPRKNIVGKPMFVYFSWDSDIPFSEFFNLVASIRLDRVGKFLY